jgi:hypothetical protein
MLDEVGYGCGIYHNLLSHFLFWTWTRITSRWFYARKSANITSCFIALCRNFNYFQSLAKKNKIILYSLLNLLGK